MSDHGLSLVEDLRARDRTRRLNSELAARFPGAGIDQQVERLRIGMSSAIEVLPRMLANPELWDYGEFRRPGIVLDYLRSSVGRLGIEAHVVRPATEPQIHSHTFTCFEEIQAGEGIERAKISPVASLIIESRHGYRMTICRPDDENFEPCHRHVPLLAGGATARPPLVELASLKIQQGDFYCLPSPLFHKVERPFASEHVRFESLSVFVVELPEPHRSTDRGRGPSKEDMCARVSSALESFPMPAGDSETKWR